MSRNPTDFVFRSANESDLEAIYSLAGKAGSGLTTLPHDRELIKKKILNSQKSFHYMTDKPGVDSYLFVLEDTTTSQVVGTSAIFSKTGGFEPFWTYKIDYKHNRSQSLNVDKYIPYLRIKKIHSGPSEIGTLYLQKDYRGGAQGRLLSLSRFLFIKQFRNAFENTVIAELRGQHNKEGKYPFWKAIGKHFFDVSFAKADSSVNIDKTFISELMPPDPIYIPLLPKDAQEVIGQVHPNTEPAKKLLEQEGFQFCNEVDIFEGGPVYSCVTNKIRTIKKAKSAIISSYLKTSDEPHYLICNTSKAIDFRSCLGSIKESMDGAMVIKDVAKKLHLKIGDSVIWSPLYPNKKGGAT
jgi:arginine N-succinyltransferase